MIAFNLRFLNAISALGRIACLFGVMLISACASDPADLSFVQSAEYSGVQRPILVATSRVRIDDEAQRYGAGRSDTLSFDEITVWVPEDRQRGSLPYPKERHDPNSEFGVTEMQSLPADTIIDEINARLSVRSVIGQFIFVYIHGYNNPYSHGIYRHAQISHDFTIEGAPVHYSWPSAGRALQYMYDRDSAQFARDGLVELLIALSKTNAETIMLMAHSMGTLVTMEAIRQLSFAGADDVIEKLSPVMLASPDIDVDVFRSQLKNLSLTPEPIVVFASTEDKALRFSQRLRGGHPRVGSAGNLEELSRLGVEVVNLSDITDGDRSRHATFSSSPTLIRIMNDAKTMADTILSADRDEDSETSLQRRDSLISDLVEIPRAIGELPVRAVEGELGG